MNYNSWIFWLLFAGVIGGYWRLSHRAQNRLLLVASYLFYGFWDYRFLFLVLLSTVIDFIGGLGVSGIRISRSKQRNLALLTSASAFLLSSGINYSSLVRGDFRAGLPHHFSDFAVPTGTTIACLLYGVALPRLYALPETKRRKAFLTISMIANLSILAYFKYAGFFLESLRGGLHTLGLSSLDIPTLHILLPAGISFYTFQAMSYTIDIYRGETKPTENFLDFALFVCFFPHLVAGPIMRAHTLLPQVIAPRKLKPGAFEEGLLLVLVGMFKKIVIADNMAPLANAIFSRFSDGHAGGLSGFDTLIGIYAFAFQIYGDFSGYSAVARGISKWLGFDLVVNFRNPYLAVSPSDFWRRWHISLSTWLRDYLYIPLGGNRGGTFALYRNLMITMTLGGLWHGASWTFAGWGIYHGAILCGFRTLNISDPKPEKIKSIKERLIWIFRVGVMFHLTCFGWLLFRAETPQIVFAMSRKILTDFHLTGFGLSTLALLIFHCAVLFVLEWRWDGENRLPVGENAPIKNRSVIRSAALYIYLLVMLLIFHAETSYAFIYFQF